MNNYKQDLTFYYQSCNEVADMFTQQYFCDKHTDITDTDRWWVGGNSGTVFCINDYFWNMEDMVEALKVGVNRKTIFEYYDWMVDDNGVENKSLHYYLNLKKTK